MPFISPSVLSGPGLHSGLPARLRMRLRTVMAPMEGPCFRFPGRSLLRAAELGGLARSAHRSTRLGEGGSAIGTPEHLLAALLFFAAVPVDMECDTAELPGLDGSALPYREALAALAPAAAAEPAWREYASGLSWEYHWSYGHIRVRPAAAFRAEWKLDRPPLSQSFRLEDPTVAYRDILPARTFAFHSEWRQAIENGLMAGAGEDSGLLLAASETEYREVLSRYPQWRGGPYPLLNQSAWRMQDEPVKHKLLDLLGDLALVDLALPKLEIEVCNGGHAVNHLLVAKLLAAR